MKANEIYKFKPFTTTGGRKIVNSLCVCGSRQTEHLSSIPGLPESNGHGPNPNKGCPKFTWERYVYAVTVKK